MTWKITDHLCSACLGRILYNGESYRCSNCGNADSSLPKVCCCGATLKSGKNAGLRCTRNHTPTPDCPGEIVVTHGN